MAMDAVYEEISQTGQLANTPLADNVMVLPNASTSENKQHQGEFNVPYTTMFLILMLANLRLCTECMQTLFDYVKPLL